MATEMVLGKRPAFIFMSGGRVQCWKDDRGHGPIAATNQEAAEVVKINLEELSGKMISITECGSAEYETMAARFSEPMRDRAVTGMFITEEGQENCFFQAPPLPD